MTMLTRVKIKNYRCLRDVDVELEPFTVLVGPNGSGKSTLMQALLASTVDFPHHVWQHDTSLTVQLQFHHGDVIRSETLRASRVRTVFPPAVDGQAHTFSTEAIRRPNTSEQAQRVATDGSNCTNVFDTIGRKRQEEFSKLFAQFVPHFSDVDVRPLSAGERRIRFEDRWKSGVWYEPNEVSDGTMLAFAYLLLRFQESPADFIAIEEPERGLHPFLLGKLIELLRGLTTGQFGGKPIQVMLATHSAELLNFVEPNEVRFFSRDAKDGSVVIEKAPPDSNDWRKAYHEYQDSLGSMWLSGGLGGVPGN
jgi:predicted ATPase